MSQHTLTVNGGPTVVYTLTGGRQGPPGPDLVEDRAAIEAAAAAVAADAVATAADRVQTGLDRVATAADRVQTGLDRVQTGTDRTTATAQAAAAAASRAAIDNRIYPTGTTSDPTTRPDGSSVQSGDMYFNTASGLWKRYSGSTWVASDVNTANLAASAGSALIGHISTATGGVATTLQAKVRDMGVSAKADFGAVGDNVASDEAAFSAARAHAAAASELVYVPRGTYKVTSSTYGTTDYFYGPGTVKQAGTTDLQIPKYAWGAVHPDSGQLQLGRLEARYFPANASQLNITLGAGRVSGSACPNLRVQVDAASAHVGINVGGTLYSKFTVEEVGGE